MKKPLIFLSLFLLQALCSNAQNINLSNGNIFDGEPFIAVNPVNSQNMVVCWMGFVPGNGSGLTIRVRSTFDGGLTWGSTINMPHYVPTYMSADPSMAFDENGKLFISYIDYRKTPDSGGVYIFSSIDGGTTWNQPVKAIDAYDDGVKIPVDRPWLVSNKGGDRLYLTTKPAPWILPPNRPYFLTSGDSGLNWGSWRYVDSTGFLTGNLIAGPMATPAVGSNGSFYCVYPSFLPSQGLYPRYILAKSSDHGNSMQYTVVQNIYAPAVNDSAKLAYLLLADPSDSNHLVFIYPDATLGDIDIRLSESYDDGISWSLPLRINDDATGNGKMQDMIWASFDDDGDLVITWRDRRNATGTGFSVASDYYAAFRDKDSVNFAVNFLLSDSLVPFHNILAMDGNDFMCAVLKNDTVNAVWANTRDGSLDVWFMRVYAPAATVSGIILLSDEGNGISVFPNPSLGVFHLELKNQEILNSITVVSQDGKLILNRRINELRSTIDLTNNTPGRYLLKVISKSGVFYANLNLL